MGWLSKAESKVYTGFREYGGSYLEVSHAFNLTEGRFFKIENGYVLLGILESATGFKVDPEPGTKFALEIHSSKYKRKVAKGNDFVEEEFEPTWFEVGCIEFLNNVPELLEVSVTGQFMFSTTIVTKMMIERESIGEWIFKRLNRIAPTGKIEFKQGSGYQKKGGGGYSQSEAQKIQDRLNALYNAYASVIEIEPRSDATLSHILAIAAGFHQQESTEHFAELAWKLNCLIMGVSIAPPSNKSVEF